MNPPGPAPTPVIFDVNVLLRTVTVGESPFRCWSSPPPASTNPSADCIGIVDDTAEFALWLSPHILSTTGRVLAEVVAMPEEEIDGCLAILVEMAEASGGGTVKPPQAVGDCPDWEDNGILDLAVETGAFLIVSADADLTTMSVWRGRPIIEPGQFTAMVDGAWSARRRRR